MAKIGQGFVCKTCGNGVLVIKKGRNPKVGCCGKPMMKKKLLIR